MVKYLKKCLYIVASILLLSGVLACKQTTVKNDKINIVCTIFPEYNWVKEIVGDSTSVNVKLLMNGVDPHSYQSTTEDVLNIVNSDLLVYVGGESDEWIEEAILNNSSKDIKTVNLLKTLGEKAKTEETIEGMQGEEEHGESEEEVEYDEHVWMSLNNAKIFCKEIRDKLIEILPDEADELNANFSKYMQEIDELSNAYISLTNSEEDKTIIVADRFPFRYLVDDYQIKYYAAFPGCSAETEASANTITFLAEKVNELNIKYIFVLSTSDKEIAKTVIGATSSKNQEIISLESMETISTDDYENGITYLSIMSSNLNKLNITLTNS